MESTAAAEWIDHEPSVSRFMADALRGLTAKQKSVAAKYFYDARGSELFERITHLPEYYPTRTEISILTSEAASIVAACGDDFSLVEFGSGSSTKVRILLDAMERRSCYVAVDISPELLRISTDELTREYPDLTVLAICADYTQPFEIPACGSAGRRVIFFPGSTIGNFEPQEARAFLRIAAAGLSAGDSMVVGFDLKKDQATLTAAYNDAEGVTADFNLNVLQHMNRELGSDFDISQFEHYAFYNADAGRIEMHLRSLVRQEVDIGGRRISFDQGELLHTENSYKYSEEDITRMIEGTRFVAAQKWMDTDELFCVQRLEVR